MGHRLQRLLPELSNDEFIGQTEPFRRELLSNCHQMLRSPNDAEDVVQETYLRAWHSFHTFEGRSSLRTWLYQIATRASLDWLERSGRQPPTGMHRQTTRLALIAALRHLPPRQRAVLILRDVLGWRSAEVAELLDTTDAAVKSALQRARARLAEVTPSTDRPITEPPVPGQRATRRTIAKGDT